MIIHVAILELFPTSTHKLLHPGAENSKSCLLNNISKKDISNPIIFETMLVSSEDIRRDGFLDSFQVIIIPGGSSGHQARNLKKHGMLNIRKFVAEGGGYVGICAGAYLALSHYEPDRSLRLMHANALSDWQRGHFRVPISFLPNGLFLICSNVTENDDDICNDDSRTRHVYSGGGDLAQKNTLKKEGITCINNLSPPSNGKYNKSLNHFKSKPITHKPINKGAADVDVDDVVDDDDDVVVHEDKDTNGSSEVNVIIARFNNGPCMINAPPICENTVNENTIENILPGVPTWLAIYDQGIQSSQTKPSPSSAAAAAAESMPLSSKMKKKKMTKMSSNDSATVFLSELNVKNKKKNIPLSNDVNDMKDIHYISTNNEVEDESIGTYAAATCEFGKGRVILLSPHFESTPLELNSLSKTAKSNEKLKLIVRNAVKWAAAAEIA